MNISIVKKGSLYIAELIKDKQRIITSVAEVTVIVLCLNNLHELRWHSASSR